MIRNSTLARAILLCSSVIAPAVIGGSAIAQTSEDSAGKGSLLDVVVVTAQKRSQNLQDVPVSVSAITGNQLDQLGISDTTAITEQIPGMQLNTWSPNVTIFNLRGISQNNFQDNLEAPVAVYMDDAYMGSMNGISGQLFDLNRVEVLRGPQGTLFGRNATGGLVHYVSRGATDSDFNGYVRGSYGRFKSRSLEGAIGGAITDGWRFRLATRRELGGNYIKSADADPANGLFGDGQNLGGQNAYALRATTQIDVTPDLMVELWYKYSRDHNVPTGGYVFDNCDFLPNGFCHVNPAGLTDGSGGVINGITGAKASPFQNFSNTPGFLYRRVNIGQANITWNLGGVTLTSITNYTHFVKHYQEDGDAIPITVIIFQTDVNYDQFSQETRLSGNTDHLDWQMGAYYLDMTIDGRNVTQGAPVLAAALDINGAANSPLVTEPYRLDSKNWSLFGQAEYHFTHKFSVIGGLRYSKDNKSIDYTSLLLDSGFPDAVLQTDKLLSAANPGLNRIAHGDYAARVSLNWKPQADTLIFASYNRGIKGGNWTLSPNITPATFRHGPETLHSFELGFKYTTPGQRLRVNGTAFHYIYNNYQAFAIFNGNPQVTNADALASGAELEATWEPIDRFSIRLGSTWETSKVKRTASVGQQIAPEFFPGAPNDQYCTNIGGAFQCTFPQKFITDAKFPNAPKFSFNYLFRYDFDLPVGTSAVQVDGVWYDKQYLEVTNGRSSLQPSYNVTNASVSWTDPSEKVQLTLWAKNIFDKAYRAYTLNLGVLGTTSYYAPPATYGVTARFSW